MITINLQQYRIPNSKILYGKDFGIQARRKLKLDEIDKTEEQGKAVDEATEGEASQKGRKK